MGARQASRGPAGHPPAMLDPGIKLRHLAAFLAVARREGFARAAAELNVSQPAVSKTIRELEELLGLTLIERGPGPFRLTGFGRTFLRHAAISMAALHEGVEAVRRAGAPEVATVSVGALPTVSARILPAAVEAFRRQDLAARARVITGPNDYLQAQLRLGAVDMVVGRMGEPDRMAGFAFEHLYSERIVLAVRPGHPLHDDVGPLPRRLSGFPMLLPPPGSIIRPAVDRLLLSLGVSPPEDAVETVSTAFGRGTVATTDAVWIISEGVVAHDVETGALMLLPVDTADTLGPVGLTTRVDVALSIPGEALAGEIRAVAARYRLGRP